MKFTCPQMLTSLDNYRAVRNQELMLGKKEEISDQRMKNILQSLVSELTQMCWCRTQK